MSREVCNWLSLRTLEIRITLNMLLKLTLLKTQIQISLLSKVLNNNLRELLRDRLQLEALPVFRPLQLPI
jgi:hypothetical protein